LSHEEAISEESRPENKYDMHSQEAAYLAEGQARLAAEIAANLALYETLALPAVRSDSIVALGIAVAIERGTKRTWYFIGPRAGGTEIEVDGTPILVVTPQSPLGRELMGKQIGDTVKMPGRAAGSIGRIVELA
jgi:transcription elongation GreA/GreB family factor